MEISPEVLVFPAPIDEQVGCPLYLKNTTTAPLAYKIKTTAPKLYSVRPNALLLEPGQSIEVSITRQAKDQPKRDEKVRDKFLVLSAPLPNPELASTEISALWTAIETEAKQLIISKKLKVHYDFSAELATPSKPTEEFASTPAGASSLLSGSAASPGVFETPQKDLSSQSAGSLDTDDAPTTALSTAEDSANGLQLTDAEEAAHKEISSKSKELKQQATPEPGFSIKADPAPVSTSGVPPLYVAVLVLIAVIITRLLFISK